MSETSAEASAAAVSAEALKDEVMRSTWPQRCAERINTLEQLIGEVIASEFTAGGHFIPITANVTALGRDETTTRNRAGIVAEILDGKTVCTRGQLLVKCFFGRSDDSLDDQLEALSGTTFLETVRIDGHRHTDPEEVILRWRRL